MKSGQGHSLAIIAGGGVMPLEVARLAQRCGWNVHIAGISGFADTRIEHFSHVWVKLGELGKLYRQLEAWQCRTLVIVGAVIRPQFGDIGFDLGALSSLPDIAKLLRGGDDSVLDGVVRFFEGRGYEVLGPLDVAPQLAAEAGAMTANEPSGDTLADIRQGAELLRVMSPFDIGQAVVMASGRAIAVEALEGTDAMLERAAALRASGRWRVKGRCGVLVKLAKRGQNLRVDLPAIGPRTIELARAAALEGIAVGAGQVLVAERERTLAEAAKAGLFLYGIDP